MMPLHYTLVRVAGGEPNEAAYLANAAASVVVMKSRAATLSVDELVAAVERDGDHDRRLRAEPRATVRRRPAKVMRPVKGHPYSK